MLNIRICDAEKKVYVNVSGYITSKDAKDFLADYKKRIKGIRTQQYRLVVEPGVFKCENDKDIKNVCISFFKHNYRQIYIIDPEKSIMETLSLSSMEKKIFLKSVSIINSRDEVK